RYLLFEVKVELTAAHTRKMTLVADPREAEVLGPGHDLELMFGGMSFLRSKDQVEVLWRFDEAPYLFPQGDDYTIKVMRSHHGHGVNWCRIPASRDDN
ncbi:MAG: hypothetical protein WBA46_09895, partial [Thermomicrobiales bacterium]